MAECAHCGGEFEPRKAGHVFCSVFCRHRGEREPHDRAPVDHEQVARLFDESRDADERVRADDWHPDSDSNFAELDAWDTVGKRRGWYERLVLLGRL